MRPIITTLLVGLLAASAQQVPEAQKQAAPAEKKNAAGSKQQPFKFDVTTQLVVETLNLKDKSGNLITGLTKDDFTVTEDGKAQKIDFVEFAKLEDTPEVAPEPTPGVLERRPEKEPAAAGAAPAQPAKAEPPPKAVTANQISPETSGDLKYKDRRLLVMYFDMISMPIQDQMRAQDAALKFLKTSMTKSDLVAIMTFATDMKVVEDFTDDRDLLAKDIKKLIIGEGLGFDIADTSDAAADTGAAATADDSEFNIFNTDRQLSALETAVKMLAGLNEQKALVYFASGMQKQGLDNQAQLQATINAAIRSNVKFYPIDARGLVASAPLGDATKGGSGGSGMYTGSSARSAQSSFQGQQDTLYTLAADTGGKALLDNPDLSMGLVQAQKDITSYYILGYRTTNPTLDGHFRRVKIALKPELQARVSKFDYRQGYFANKDFTKFNSDDKERQLAEALLMGDPITNIDIAMEIDYFRLARDRYFVPVAVKIPGTELELAKQGKAETARIDFIGVVKDSAGKTVQNVRDFAEVKLAGASAELAKRPVAYDTGFTLAPGSYSIRFLARDSVTGRIGTYDQKFVIPDLTAAQNTLPISSVVLSSQRVNQTDVAFAAQRDRALLDANPLIEGGKRLVPSVTRVFKKDQEMYVYLQAYEPTAETTQPLVATVSFFRGRIPAFATAPLQVTEGLTKSKSLALRFDVPLAKLQTGKYTCQVTVIDATGQKFNTWRAPVMLVQ